MDQNYFKSLTSIRGIAAFMVVMFHFRYVLVPISTQSYHWFSSGFFNRGDLWVDFFFLLSGFVLSHRYRTELFIDRRSIWSYFILRFARIYPVHFFMLLAYLAYNYFRFGSLYFENNLSAIVGNLFLVHSWGKHFGGQLNFPSWSLSCEAGAYLLFPLLLLFARRVQGVLFNFIVYLFSFGCLIYLSHQLSSDSLGDMKEVYGLLRCIPEFLMGMFLYSMARTHLRGIRKIQLLLFFASLIGLGAFFSNSAPEASIALIASLMILSLLDPGPRIAKLTQSKALQWLGEISFSLYMTHALIMEIVLDYFRSISENGPSVSSLPFTCLIFFGLIASCLIVAHCVRYCIEEPMHRWLCGYLTTVSPQSKSDEYPAWDLSLEEKASKKFAGSSD